MQKYTDRHDRWTKASFAVASPDPVGTFMSGTIQGLGRVDVQLIRGDDFYLSQSPSERDALDASFHLTDRITLSYLWILGAYEVVRTLDQMVREETFQASPESSKQIHNSKRKFERLRIPLAKFEASRASKGQDSPVAYPGIHQEHGIAWHINLSTWISRRELSNEFLELLEHIRAERRITDE